MCVFKAIFDKTARLYFLFLLKSYARFSLFCLFLLPGDGKLLQSAAIFIILIVINLGGILCHY